MYLKEAMEKRDEIAYHHTAREPKNCEYYNSRQKECNASSLTPGYECRICNFFSPTKAMATITNSSYITELEEEIISLMGQIREINIIKRYANEFYGAE